MTKCRSCGVKISDSETYWFDDDEYCYDCGSYAEDTDGEDYEKDDGHEWDWAERFDDED